LDEKFAPYIRSMISAAIERISFGRLTARQAAYAALALVYLFFCWLMMRITLQYVPISTDVAFLRIKQDYIGMTHYQTAFFVHVFTAIAVLPAGLTQFSRYIRKHYRNVHRGAGYVYVVAVVLLAGPSGFVIGIYANGGLSSQIAFCLLAALWVYFTIKAVQTIRSKKVGEHRRWMIRSFALALSAITLRAWKYAIVAALEPRPMDVYVVVAWLGWVLNLVVAEYIIYRRYGYGA
jgi:uncharacterized membrane protein